MDNPYETLRESYKYCVVCGSASGKSEAHHVMYRSAGGEEEGNLVLLCEACHARVHRGDMRLELNGKTLVIVDTQTGEISVKPLVPQVSTAPSQTIDELRAIQNWMDELLHSDKLRQETDEALRTLYQDVRHLKKRAWMIQAAIIAVMQERAVRGDRYREAIAEAVGCHVRTVNARGQIYRDIISNPECAQAMEIVEEESFYREAVASPEAAKWINYAADKKVENPKYTVAQFRAEMGSDGGESTLSRVEMYCRDYNLVDEKLAENLERRLGVPVRIVVEDSLSNAPNGTIISVTGRTVSNPTDISHRGERIAAQA